MANPTIQSGAVHRLRRKIIVTCQVDNPPLKNLIGQPANGWNALVNGNGIAVVGAKVASPEDNQVTLDLINSVLDSDEVKFYYSSSFGDTYDDLGNPLTTILQGNAITCTFAPAGCLILPMLNLRALLAGCPSWRSWSGASDVPTARNFVHIIAPTEPTGTSYSTAELEALRGPVFAKINWGGGAGTFNSSRMANGKFTAEGQLELSIEAAVADENQASEIESETDFLAHLEALMSEMARMDEGLGFLAAHSISIADGPRRSARRSKSSEGNYYVARLTVGFNSPL